MTAPSPTQRIERALGHISKRMRVIHRSRLLDALAQRVLVDELEAIRKLLARPPDPPPEKAKIDYGVDE